MWNGEIMKRNINRCITRGVLFILIVISIKTSFSNQGDFYWGEWQQFGLSGKQIYSIAYLKKSKKLIAGVKEGLYIYNSSKWIPIPLTIPKYVVIDIVESKSGDIVVAHKSSPFDLILIGKMVDTIPFFIFNTKIQVPKVHSVAIKDNSPNVVYYGYKDTVWQIQKDKEIRQEIKILCPEKCFGDRNPICTDLYIPEITNQLVVSGFDSLNNQKEGKGSLLSLESNNNFSIMRTLRANSISECRNILNPVKGNMLFVGTDDSGVCRYDYIEKSWRWLPPLLKQEKVKQLTSYQMEVPISHMNNNLIEIGSVAIIVTQSGVYFSWIEGEQYYNWAKTDNIPSVPTSICYNSLFEKLNWDVEHFVGTENGVYKNTSHAFGNKIKVNSVSEAKESSLYSFFLKDEFVIFVNNSSYTGPFVITVIDSKGRNIYSNKEFYSDLRKNIIVGDSFKRKSGMYIIQLSIPSINYVKQQKIFITK